MLEVARKPNQPQPAGSKTPTARVNTNPWASDAVESNHDQAPGQNPSHRVTPALVKEQAKIPVITGQAQFTGVMPVNGILLGQLGNKGGSLDVRQKPESGLRSSEPELSGQLSFRDLVRVNGHIAGTVYSQDGTLIVDSGAAVDANVHVAIAVIKGTVNGDIVAQQRVELGPGAKVFGNIWTRSLAVDAGAIFDGDCTMLPQR